MKTILLLVALASSAAAQADAREPLNVVFFLVDDLGWRDLSCQGSRFYETPHIDALAARGVRFTDAYAACAVCSPTRAAILTGKHPARLMLTQWIPGGRWDPESRALCEGRTRNDLPLVETTLPEVLREAGYLTRFIGKWHLGGLPFSHPEHHGFDDNVAGNDFGNPGSYFHPFRGKWRVPSTELRARWQTFDGGREGDYLTDVLTDEALRRLEQARGEDAPFLLYMSYYAVHTPLQAKADKIRRYEQKPPDGGQANAIYAAMIETVDDSVGRIVAKLEELDMTERTMIVFTSDNGGFWNASSQAPLRAHKGTFHEGGIRVPAIVCVPGTGAAGATCAVPIASPDFYPTILAALGLEPRPVQHVDGIDLSPWLREPSAPAPDRALFWHYPHYNQHPDSFPCSVVRHGRWKLIERFDPEGIELYDLERDLGETRDVAKEHPDVVGELQARLAQWRTEVDAESMAPNPLSRAR